MPNLIPQCMDVEKWIKKGAPGGPTRALAELPTLLRRIRELESALLPFVKATLVNKSIASKPDTLVSVLYKDCQEAYNKMDPAQGVPVQQPAAENAGFGEPAQF